MITNFYICNYPSCTVTAWFGLVTSKCIVIFFWWGGGSPTTFLSKIKISFFQNVVLDELITNHYICNYPSCTVTEWFGLVTSNCNVIFWGRGSPKIFLSEIKISLFQYVALNELITNHTTCNYPSCTVTELFKLVTSKCIVIFLGKRGAHQKFLVYKIKMSFVQNVNLDELITNHPNCNYSECAITELFGLVTSKCFVICFGGRLTKNICCPK